MATTFYEKTTQVIANDETKLKDCIQAKVGESCCANDNWLNASIQYGTPSAWKLTPAYISVLVLDEAWEYYDFTKSKPDPYPRVVLLKPPDWKKTFSSVRAKDDHGGVLWELHDSKIAPTEGIYVALVPGGCTVEFLHVDVKYLGPKEGPAHEGEPTAGPSRAKDSSEESGEDTPRQTGVMARESGEDTPRQPGVFIRESASKQLAEETYPSVPTHKVDNERHDCEDDDMD